MEKIERSQLPGLFSSVAKIMEEESERLCEMDAKMGDGDLGLTMKKGFGVLPGAIESLEGEPLGKTIMKAAMKMSSAVPSTMGTLMSSGLMSAGKALGDREEIDASGLAEFWRGFAEGIKKRGKCERGDRTVLDAVAEAADMAENALAKDPDASLTQVSEAALKGAGTGVEKTKDMTPKFGKAAVFSAQAKGVPDQGATAGWLLVKGVHDFICS